MGSILPSLAIPTVSAKERERKGRALFCVGQGSIAVLPLNAAGRNTHFPNISGHTGAFLVLPFAAIDCTFIGFVNDFEFSPFYDNTLCTGGADGVVRSLASAATYLHHSMVGQAMGRSRGGPETGGVLHLLAQCGTFWRELPSNA